MVMAVVNRLVSVATVRVWKASDPLNHPRGCRKKSPPGAFYVSLLLSHHMNLVVGSLFGLLI